VILSGNDLCQKNIKGIVEMNLLVKKDTRIIDIGGGFIAEVYMEQMVEYNHKIYITHEDFTCAKYLISSVIPKYGTELQGEKSIVEFLRQADNYKEVWYSKLKEIDSNIRMFETD
jgi:hypothetical protein